MLRASQMYAALLIARLSAALAGLCGSFTLIQAQVFAQDVELIASHAKAITVRIEGATQGSGVITRKSGGNYSVLTAWHVVKAQRSGEELYVITHDSVRHKVNLLPVKVDHVDLALISFKSKNDYEVAQVGDSELEYNQKVLVAGYPISSPQKLKKEPGNIAYDVPSTHHQDGYVLLYSAPTLAGMSGGPILTAEGRLAGIHGRGSRNEFLTRNTGVLTKTGVNSGIPVRYYLASQDGTLRSLVNRRARTAADYMFAVHEMEDKKATPQDILVVVNQGLSLSATSATTANLLVSKATAYHRLKKKSEAIGILNEALNAQPNNKFLLLNIGNAYLDVDDLSEARAWFKRVVDVDPKYFWAWNKLAGVEYLSKNYNKALSYLQKSIALKPRFRDSFLLRSNILQSRGSQEDVREALSSLESAYRFDEGDLQTLLDLAGLRVKNGLLEEALEAYNKAIAIDKADSAIYTNRGSTKFNMGDSDGAYSDYLKALSLNPRDSVAAFNIGYLFLQQKKYKLAIEYFDKAEESLGFEPEDVMGDRSYMGSRFGQSPYYIYLERGNALTDMGSFRRARIEFSRAINHSPSNPLAWRSRSHLNVLENRYDEACSDLKRASSLGDSYVRSFLASKDGQWCQ